MSPEGPKDTRVAPRAVHVERIPTRKRNWLSLLTVAVFLASVPVNKTVTQSQEEAALRQAKAAEDAEKNIARRNAMKQKAMEEFKVIKKGFDDSISEKENELAKKKRGVTGIFRELLGKNKIEEQALKKMKENPPVLREHEKSKDPLNELSKKFCDNVQNNECMESLSNVFYDVSEGFKTGEFYTQIPALDKKSSNLVSCKFGDDFFASTENKLRMQRLVTYVLKQDSSVKDVVRGSIAESYKKKNDNKNPADQDLNNYVKTNLDGLPGILNHCNQVILKSMGALELAKGSVSAGKVNIEMFTSLIASLIAKNLEPSMPVGVKSEALDAAKDMGGLIFDALEVSKKKVTE